MMVNVAQLAHIMMIGHGRALIQRLMIEQISQMKAMYANVGRKRRMINQIEDMKKRIDELSKMVKRKSDENESLKAENKALKQRIKDLEDVCDRSCFSDETNDRDEKIAKMQDRIDSDCVRINRLKVTINTLVDMYGLLRNQVGMD